MDVTGNYNAECMQVPLKRQNIVETNPKSKDYGWIDPWGLCDTDPVILLPLTIMATLSSNWIPLHSRSNGNYLNYTIILQHSIQYLKEK